RPVRLHGARVAPARRLAELVRAGIGVLGSLNKKSEIRSPKSERVLFRISGFGFPISCQAGQRPGGVTFVVSSLLNRDWLFGALPASHVRKTSTFGGSAGLGFSHWLNTLLSAWPSNAWIKLAFSSCSRAEPLCQVSRASFIHAAVSFQGIDWSAALPPRTWPTSAMAWPTWKTA